MDTLNRSAIGVKSKQRFSIGTTPLIPPVMMFTVSGSITRILPCWLIFVVNP